MCNFSQAVLEVEKCQMALFSVICVDFESEKHEKIDIRLICRVTHMMMQDCGSRLYVTIRRYHG